MLLKLSEPLEDVYMRAAHAHGVRGLTRESVKANWRAAWAAPRPANTLRYDGDASSFWRKVVAAATGCADEALFAELFAHYARGNAWTVASNAHDALARLRDAGVRLAVCSNFDIRLRPLLHDLALAPLFDSLVISAEVGAEKPDARIFRAAAAALDTPIERCLHVGDDAEADIAGALAAGCADAWLFSAKGGDVHTFDALADRLLRA